MEPSPRSSRRCARRRQRCGRRASEHELPARSWSSARQQERSTASRWRSCARPASVSLAYGCMCWGAKWCVRRKMAAPPPPPWARQQRQKGRARRWSFCASRNWRRMCRYLWAGRSRIPYKGLFARLCADGAERGPGCPRSVGHGVVGAYLVSKSISDLTSCGAQSGP